MICFSICGHTLPTTPGASMSMYYASKHAVTVLTEGLRQELNGLKSKIRVAVRNKKLTIKNEQSIFTEMIQIDSMLQVEN